MSTPSTQQLIDQRLDLMDQALLGLLPRPERLAMIAQVETRLRELQSAGTLPEADLRMPQASPALATLAASASARPTRGKLSKLALSAGILGILALLLMFVMPITYVLAALLEDMLGDQGAIVMLGSHVLLVAIGGTAAVVLGIAALVRMGSHPERFWGRGWAITGLCTGPLPMLAGGLLLLVTTTVSVAASSSSPVVWTPQAGAYMPPTPVSAYQDCPPCSSGECNSRTLVPPPSLPAPIAPARAEPAPSAAPLPTIPEPSPTTPLPAADTRSS